MPYIVQDRVRFLLEAGRILSTTLDYNVTLVSIAKLLVEGVCDFCIIDILEKDGMNRVVVRSSKKSDQVLANKFFKFLPDPRNKEAIYAAAMTGLPILIQKVTPQWLRTVSQIEEERQSVKKLQLNSFIFAPLRSRGRVIGVITIASNKSDFSYSDEDVAFIDAIATRAALAVDNSKLYSEAQAALNSRDEFLSIASHELKTPLTSVLLALQFAIRRMKNQDKKNIDKSVLTALETGVIETRRLSALMSDLLNISVISTGKLKIDKEESDLVQIISDAISGFKILMERRDIKIIYRKREDVIIGMWDKVRMGEVFSNFLSNAIKYGKGRPILIESAIDKGRAIVKIKDRGIGIEQEDRESIFELFKRTKNAADYKGMGVGLYIANQIVSAHNGKIIVESKPGEGSAFTIELPL